MRKLLPLLALLLLFCVPSRACTTSASVIACAAGNNFTGTSVSSVSTGSTLNISTGQLIHVGCATYFDPGTITVTDTSSTNTFTASPDGLAGQLGGFMEDFYVLSAVAKASDTITCHFTNSIAYDGIMVVQGTTGYTLDTHATCSNGLGCEPALNTTPTSGSFTTTGATDLIIFDAWFNPTSACSAGTNFTIQNDESSSGQSCDESWVTSTSQSGITATMTTAMASYWTLELLAYKPPTGAVTKRAPPMANR